MAELTLAPGRAGMDISQMPFSLTMAPLTGDPRDYGLHSTAAGPSPPQKSISASLAGGMALRNSNASLASTLVSNLGSSSLLSAP